MRQWLKRLPKPVAVLACNDLPACDLAVVCRSLGLRVPDDVALLGVDNDELECRLATPPISSIDIPAQRIGYEAARLLDQLLHGKRPANRSLFLPPIRVVTRQSTDTLATGDHVVRAALSYIREHATSGITVDSVVRQIDASRRELERHFRRVLGRSVLTEIRRVRRGAGQGAVGHHRPGHAGHRPALRLLHPPASGHRFPAGNRVGAHRLSPPFADPRSGRVLSGLPSRFAHNRSVAKRHKRCAKCVVASTARRGRLTEQATRGRLTAETRRCSHGCRVSAQEANHDIVNTLCGSWCNAVLRVRLAPAGELAKPLYRDASQPIERRIEDLLGRMTLEEKVGQMNMPCVYEHGLGKSIPREDRGRREVRGGKPGPGSWPGRRLLHPLQHDPPRRHPATGRVPQPPATDRRRTPAWAFRCWRPKRGPTA